jgi:hypothetical protein
MKVDRQKKLWEQVFKARQLYIKQCRIGTTSTSGYADYDPLVKQMCSYFANMDAISTTYDETTLDSINGLCRDVFCGDDQEGPFFCTTEEESDPVCIESNGQPPKDVIKVILFTIIAILVIFIAMYYLLNGGKIDLSFMDVGFLGKKFGLNAIPGLKGIPDLNGVTKNMQGIASGIQGVTNSIPSLANGLPGLNGVAKNIQGIASGIQDATNSIPGLTSWGDKLKGIKETAQNALNKDTWKNLGNDIGNAANAIKNVADNAAKVVKNAALHPADTIAKII